MPRQIQICSQCSVRFIAASVAVVLCDTCSNNNGEGTKKRRKVSSETTKEPCIGSSDEALSGSANAGGATLDVSDKGVETVEVGDSDSEKSDEKSEGADDFHCSQFVGLDSTSSSDSWDMPLGSLGRPSADGKSSACHEKRSVTSETNEESLVIENEIDLKTAPIQDSKDCFICGSSLEHITTGVAGRINHIKRCSKKHGVTGRDVRLDDDNEIFEMNQTRPSDQSSVKMTTSNPYAKQNTTTAASWNERGSPQRSAFGMLLAGAKRAAKIALIKASEKDETKKRWGSRQWGGNVDYSKRPCPKYKQISGTDFVCDGFHYAKQSLTQNYFLTHFHSDHWGGITKSWNAGTIYCSSITATLVNQQLGVDWKYLHVLPMMTPTCIGSRGTPVTVTLLNANHCPGAVMFLFEIGKRTVLHVGDFRWNHEIMAAQRPLQPFFRRKQQLTELFLDTTYCDPKYCLPSQDDAIRETVQVAEEHIRRARQRKEKLLLVFGAYTIGKERIYMYVAEKLDMKVYVDSKRYRILSSLEWSSQMMSMLTTRPEASTLWVVPLGHINMKKLPSYLSLSTRRVSCRFDKVVGFRPTGWSLSSNTSTGNLVNSTTKGNVTVCGVPYSEHSSFPELLDCLSSLLPRKIVPTVSAQKSQQQVDLLLRHLNTKQTGLKV